MKLHPFDVLYIADLDAILGRGDHRREIQSIKLRHPQLALWLDQGLRHPAENRRPAEVPVHRVIGSESLPDLGCLRQLPLRTAERYAVLSLDFQNDVFLGPAEVLNHPASWPRRVIAMQLARVGSRRGPDLSRLRSLIPLSPATLWYAGGGLRDADDLCALSALGVAGALVATALHNGAIDASTLGALP